MPSLSWRPSPFGIGEVAGPRPVEGRADVVAVVRLEHDVVQRLGQLERRPGERHRVVPLVAVVEAHLELDARGELHLEPVGLPEAEPLDDERVRLVERGGGEHGVAEADALGEEPARHRVATRRAWRQRRARAPPRPVRPTAPSTRTSRSTRRSASVRCRPVDQPRDQPAASRPDDGVERRLVERLEADEHGVVGRSRPGR